MTNIPGVEGPTGSTGAQGQGAFTVTNQNFTTPAGGGTVNIYVNSTAWMAIGQTVFVGNSGLFQVQSFGVGGASPGPYFVGLYIFDAQNILSGTLCSAPQTVTGSAPSGLTIGVVGSPGFIVPTPSATFANQVSFSVNSSVPFGLGEWVSIANSGTNYGIFQIAGIGTNSIGVWYPTFVGNTSAALTVSQGSIIFPSPPGSYAPVSAYGSGTAYTLTATSALLALGTTTPAITLPVPGTYLIMGRARFDGVSATMTTQTLTTKVRRVNNTAADLANTARVFDFIPVTTTSGTFAEITIPPTAYTAGAGDQLQMWGALSGATGAGTITCVEADIIAVKLY